MVPGVPCVDVETGDKTSLCFAENFLARIGPYTLMSHTKMSNVFGENQPGKQSSRLKRSREITTEPIAE